MAYEGHAVFLPAGASGMVNHENRLYSKVDELLTAKGVSYEDDHIRREAGAALYDSGGLLVSSEFGGSFNTAVEWLGYVATFKGTSSAAFVKSLTSNTATATNPATTMNIAITVPAGGVPANDLVVVTAACNEDDVVAVAPTVSDTAGNTYTLIHNPGTTAAQMVWYSRLTSPLSAGNTITVAFTNLTTSDQDVQGVAAACQWTGIAASPFDTEVSGSGATAVVNVGPTPANTAPLPTAIISIAAIDAFNEPGSLTLTPSLGYTNHIEAGTTAAVLANDDRTIYLLSRVDSGTIKVHTLHDWYSGTVVSASTTVSTTPGSDVVTAVVGNFNNDPVLAGDTIIVNNEAHVIESVDSSSQVTTVDAWVTGNTAASFRYIIGNRLITATTGGNLFKDAPTSLTTSNIDAVSLQGGLNRNARPGFFVEGGKEAAADNRKLFYFNGVDPVQVLSGNGTSTTDITSPPSDWGTVTNKATQPVAGCIHENRLAAWGNLNDPHRVYFSDPDDHEDFTTDPFSVRFASHIGDRIFCGLDYQGILFVWKYPRGIFYLDDTSLDVTDWNYRVKSEVLGCAPSPYAALALDDDVLFLTADGNFHLLSAVDTLGGVRASDLTRRMGLHKWIRDNVNLERLDLVQSVWHAHKKVAYFAVPGTSQTDNTLLLKFDFGLVDFGGNIRFSWSDRDTVHGLALRRSLRGGPPTPVLGENTFVYLMDQEARNKNSVGYTTQYQTPHLDFGDVEGELRSKRKIYDFLEIVFAPTASGTATVDVYVDQTLRQTLTFDATERRQRKKINVGSGHTISVRITNSTADHDFKILGHIIWYHLGNEDQSLSV